MTLVLDASMALAWLFERTLAAEADCARRATVSTDETLPLPPISLARKCGLTVYDACYLELALRSGAVLATFDRRLAAAARGAGCAVFS